MSTRPAADVLVERLHQHGVRQVFGYPGGQLTPIYDALHRHGGIRHYLARQEQAAGFMADGFARASGQPGVCLAVCGPGVYNAATPLATAFTDSIPVLLISGQIASSRLGLRSGCYHENEQLQACATMTKAQVRISRPEETAEAVDRCFQVMTTGRPGPVLLEIPLDVQRTETSMDLPDLPALTRPGFGELPTLTRPDSLDLGAIEQLADLVRSWKRPLILAGGGVISAGAESELVQLAERLAAPVFTSFMGRCAIPSDHPLHAGLPWSQATSDLTDMAGFISPLFVEADGLLAVGCRFTQACTGSWTLKPPASLAQIDIDPAELGRHYPVQVGVCADARLALRELLRRLPVERRSPWTPIPAPTRPWRLPGLDLIGPLRRLLPADAIVVADINRLGYMLLADFPIRQPRTLLHPAGFVSMGYGLPAALGARAAFPERTVVAAVGDGCFLMSALELATAVQEQLPVIVVLVNDGCLTLIKAIQERRYSGRHLGVHLQNPDFGLLALSFGVRSWQVDSDEAFSRALEQALALQAPALIEVKVKEG